MLGRDRGLVLRVLPLRETSLIVSVLARQHGKLRLVARGVRGPRGRAGASLEAGNEIDFVFSSSPVRELGMLREVVLVRPWVASQKHLEAMALGWAALELLELGVPEGAPEEGLLDDAWSFLEALLHVPERAGALLLFYSFELRLLVRFGLVPELETCRACGGAPTESVDLDPLESSWICGHCRGSKQQRGGLRLEANVLQILQSMREQPWEVGTMETKAETRRAVGRTLHRLLVANVELYRYPRALALLKKVDGGSDHRVGGFEVD